MYNVFEGFFVVWDDFLFNDMFFLLDNGIYYEFLLVEEWYKEYLRVILFFEVEVGVNYVMVISINVGFWWYVFGDMVMFILIYLYKI